MPQKLPDPLPAAVRARQKLIDRRDALEQCTFGSGRVDRRAECVSIARAPAADLRGVLSLSTRDRPSKRRADSERKARPVVVTDGTREAVRRILPFKLTGDQKTVIKEIVTDMQRPQPMNRLLQGDVDRARRSSR